MKLFVQGITNEQSHNSRHCIWLHHFCCLDSANPYFEVIDMPHEDYCYALERENHALNEKYDDCVRQLTEAHARIDRFESAPKGWWHKEVESLLQQLATQREAIAEYVDRNLMSCREYADAIRAGEPK